MSKMATGTGSHTTLHDVREDRYPWRQFFVLFVAGMLGALAILPYQLVLLPEAARRLPLALVIASGIVNSAIFIAVAVGVGLAAARAVGLRAPVSAAIAYGGDALAEARRLGPWSALALGAGTAVVIIALDLALFRAQASALAAATAARPERWQGLLASFYGGLTEELLTRLLLVSVIVWLLGRIWRDADGKPASGAFVTAIVGAAALFGLGHLPATAALAPLTPPLVVRAVLLNGIAGVLFGWLYWRRGLEAAMLAHFGADVVLHVIAG